MENIKAKEKTMEIIKFLERSKELIFKISFVKRWCVRPVFYYSLVVANTSEGAEKKLRKAMEKKWSHLSNNEITLCNTNFSIIKPDELDDFKEKYLIEIDNNVILF